MIAVPGYDGETLAVFGLGRTGLTAAKALMAGGAKVLAWDDNLETRKKAEAEGVPLVDLDREDWSFAKALVLSPGVPLTHPEPHRLVLKAHDGAIPVIGDMELFAQAINAIPRDRRPKVIGITGTNGKSTTTALIGHILRKAGRDVRIGGNIGDAILGLEPPRSKTVYVIELSSYQLDLLTSLACNVAVWLNLTEDHIDRHGNMAGYRDAKFRIFANQAETDTAVVGVDDEWSAGVFAKLKAASNRNLIAVSSGRALSRGVYALGGALYDSRSGATHSVFDFSDAPTLPGQHNGQNTAAAWAALSALGLSREDIEKGISSFPGLAHRLELVGTHKGVRFINDSKATNADSAARALSSFDSIYWIAGGRKKEGGIAPLSEYFPRLAKAYLIGEAANEFAETIGGVAPREVVGTLENAVDFAIRDAFAAGRENSVILLSPACASFDQFRDFEERGDRFRSLVKARIGRG